MPFLRRIWRTIGAYGASCGYVEYEMVHHSATMMQDPKYLETWELSYFCIVKSCRMSKYKR